MTAQDWLAEYEKQLPKYKEWFPHGDKPQEGFLEAPLAYDAIWSVAFALNKSIEKLSQMGMSLDDFDYEKKDISDVIKSELQKVQFLGVSGSLLIRYGFPCSETNCWQAMLCSTISEIVYRGHLSSK